MYDYLLNERSGNERQQMFIEEAQDFRRARTAQKRAESLAKRTSTPIRRAAHLVAALIR